MYLKTSNMFSVGVDLSLEYTANQIIKQSEERIYMDQG